jgi:hypothetical protein
MSERPESLFIPLADAAALVYKQLTGSATANPNLLQEVASSISNHVRIYAREGWGTAFSLVRRDVLEAATFYGGGEYLRSRNVTFTGLRMRRDDLPTVIAKLAAVWPPKT